MSNVVNNVNIHKNLNLFQQKKYNKNTYKTALGSLYTAIFNIHLDTFIYQTHL